MGARTRAVPAGVSFDVQPVPADQEDYPNRLRTPRDVVGVDAAHMIAEIGAKPGGDEQTMREESVIPAWL